MMNSHLKLSFGTLLSIVGVAPASPALTTRRDFLPKVAVVEYNVPVVIACIAVAAPVKSWRAE
ncbi:hypothetical protein [Chitinophaga sp.]|uniref:hypothetical protein n=1 Tax=Chitinophaga sp. TaxID=1869181 RepID=UPI002F92CCD7